MPLWFIRNSFLRPCSKSNEHIVCNLRLAAKTAWHRIIKKLASNRVQSLSSCGGVGYGSLRPTWRTEQELRPVIRIAISRTSTKRHATRPGPQSNFSLSWWACSSGHACSIASSVAIACFSKGQMNCSAPRATQCENSSQLGSTAPPPLVRPRTFSALISAM